MFGTLNDSTTDVLALFAAHDDVAQAPQETTSCRPFVLVLNVFGNQFYKNEI